MSLSDKTIREINEIVQWWNWHHSTLANASVEKQNAFLLGGMNEIIKVLVTLVEDINDAGEPQIVLPKGLSLDEPLRG